VEKTRKIQDKMRDQVDELKETLEKGHPDELGKLMDQGWKYKRKLASKITSPHLDKLYQVARRAGAMGGKISGAGGGGFFTLYCVPAKQESLRKALAKQGLKEMHFSLDRFGSRAVLNIQ